MTITVLDKSNVPTGPFTRAQVAEKLQRGEISLDNLAFVEGLAQWTPLRDVLSLVDGVPPAAAPPAPSLPAYSYAATMQPPAHFVYAGFWLRVVAILIDGLILSPLVIISSVLQLGAKQATDSNSASAMAGVGLIVMMFAIFSLVVRWLYFALMESGSWQATLGKRAMGLKVTTMDGNRIGFGQATGRYFGKIISALTLMIGFIMAGVTERKQALHDMMAGTLVIRS